MLGSVDSYRRFGTPISSIFKGQAVQEKFLDIPEERKSHLHRGGSLTSRTAYHIYVFHIIITVKHLLFLK
jgi:hypothetical protein